MIKADLEYDKVGRLWESPHSVRAVHVAGLSYFVLLTIAARSFLPTVVVRNGVSLVVGNDRVRS